MNFGGKTDVPFYISIDKETTISSGGQNLKVQLVLGVSHLGDDEGKKVTLSNYDGGTESFNLWTAHDYKGLGYTIRNNHKKDFVLTSSYTDAKKVSDEDYKNYVVIDKFKAYADGGVDFYNQIWNFTTDGRIKLAQKNSDWVLQAESTVAAKSEVVLYKDPNNDTAKWHVTPSTNFIELQNGMQLYICSRYNA